MPAPSPRRTVEIQRRRPPRRARDLTAHRPDRVALWAVVMGLFLLLVAATSSRADGGNGGTPAGGDRSAQSGDYRSDDLGVRTLSKGMSGKDVRTLQRLLGVEPTGDFGDQTDAAVRQFQQSVGLQGDGVVGKDTRTALARRQMRKKKATWYGPGFYGKRTACGKKLTRRVTGVAHRSLPCGSAVTLYAHGRFVTVKVIDRGPYARGVTFDLTSATAKKLGVKQTERVRASY